MNKCQKKRREALRLSQKVNYGILLLTALAKTEQDHISIKNIAKEKGISFAFLQKTARLLHQSGLIKSERGKYGGYSLAKKPQNIAFKEIIEAVEGPMALIPCLTPSQKICTNRSNCEIKSSFEKINDELLQFFSSKKLSEIIC